MEMRIGSSVRVPGGTVQAMDINYTSFLNADETVVDK